MWGIFLQQREYLMSQSNESRRRCIVQGELGDDYVLYLLEDQEEKPVAVVLPKDAAEQPLPAAQEVRAACPCCPQHPPMLSLCLQDMLDPALLCPCLGSCWVCTHSCCL